MLAGQHSAGGNRDPDDLFAGRVDPLHHARLALVEDEQRVQVAVAGVEHVHHEQLVPFDDLVDLLEHLGQSAAGHDGVVQVVVRLDAGDGAERGLAALPQQRPLGLVRGDAHRAGTVGHADLDDALHVGFDTVGQTVDLDEQDRRGVDREPGVDVLLDRARAQLVHHLERRRHDAGGDDRAHGLRAVLDAGEVDAAACAPPAGSGVRRTQTLVAMPHMPSLPTNAPRRS